MVTKRGSSPLVSLDAVVLDTETTGPDANSDRLIQIGAVRISRGRVLEQEVFETLVNPGIPIPPSSTAIHGITNADIRTAPGFAEAYRRLVDFLADAVVIGHSIGFDLAVLKRECALAGIEWRRPRSLDTRLLGRIARPSLASYTLDTLAAWLGVEITNRHTAQGDALATAHVFQRLLSHLRERNVRTLAQAEAASRALTGDMVSMQSAGWEDPVVAGRRDTVQVLARIDSFPYRHRIRDVMSAPPVFVAADTPLKAVVALLIERRISSVFVRPPQGAPGIVTERDVLRVLAARGAEGLKKPAGEIMSRPLTSVRADAFIYRAIARMDRFNIRHLAVVDDAGAIVGALTTRNLLRQRASAALVLGDEIDFAGGEAELAAAWAGVPSMAEQLLAEEVDPRDIAAVVSREICAITRRAAELAEGRMREAGKGAAPAPYAVMVLGSGGRGESLLAADQDNAIVYAADSEEGDIDAWFAEMAGHMADTLDAVGIPYCKGGVMAKNRDWRHSVAGWRARVDEWIRRSRPEDLLNVDIFFDLRPVHGDFALALDIRAYAFEHGSQVVDFAKLLAQTVGDFWPPLGLLGGLRTQNGRIDLKRSGLLPIVTAARVLAIRHRIMSRATPERLQGLRALGIGSAQDFDHLVHAHRLILGHILRQQVEDGHHGVALSNRVETKLLTREETAELKAALRHLSYTDTMIHDLMFARPAT